MISSLHTLLIIFKTQWHCRPAAPFQPCAVCFTNKNKVEGRPLSSYQTLNGLRGSWSVRTPLIPPRVLG